MPPKTGVLLINLGTPDACHIKAVRRYLKVFLSDPRVIDVPPVLRWLLLHACILPFRAKKTLSAYEKIWTKSGSPLLVHGRNLQAALAVRLGESYQVALGMRYGSPGIPEALHGLRHCARLIILPLFPQYASASSGSALACTFLHLSKYWNIQDIYAISCFYNDPGFIKAYALIINRHMHAHKTDFLIFSYHGLPLRHIRKSGCKKHCQEACPTMEHDNMHCYRAQCYATSLALAKEMGLAKARYTTAFQSRLGRTPWIRPYTDELLPQLAKQGIKHIAVVSPAFIADCLETLEEINMRAREAWSKLGGERFTTIPCLNADPIWVEALANFLENSMPEK